MLLVDTGLSQLQIVSNYRRLSHLLNFCVVVLCALHHYSLLCALSWQRIVGSKLIPMSTVIVYAHHPCSSTTHELMLRPLITCLSYSELSLLHYKPSTQPHSANLDSTSSNLKFFPSAHPPTAIPKPLYVPCQASVTALRPRRA